MKSTDLLMIVAIAAVALATLNLIITVNKIGDYKTLSGFATDTGVANLTIQSNAQINFTTENITWGTGYVPIGETECELNTEGVMNCTGFNTISTGLIIENIGNENVNLSLESSKDAAGFIGPGAEFQWKVSEAQGNSCTPAIDITAWTDVTTSHFEQVCSNFTALDSQDEIGVDLRVVIPSTGISTDAKGVTITANADTV